MHLLPILCLSLSGAQTLPVPQALQTEVQAIFPGSEVSLLSSGQLIPAGPGELAAVAVKPAESDSQWPSFRILVATPGPDGGFEIIAGSCADTYNPTGGSEIEIRDGSLFIHATFGGMDTSESQRSQYRHDGKGLRLIGAEQQRHYHGDDAAVAKSVEVRTSTNYLTGTTIESGANGEVRARSAAEPVYLDCAQN